MIGNERNITNNTCNHQCSKCGSCCGLFIPFTEKELSIIKEYVKTNNIQPYNRNKENGFYAQCCFYDMDNKKCLIYKVRPYACRDFKCDHKDWKKKRDGYEKRAKYNSTLSSKLIMATFDDLVYGDYTSIIKYIVDVVLSHTKSDGIESFNLVELLRKINRLDILSQIKVTNDKGKTVNGEELLNEQ